MNKFIKISNIVFIVIFVIIITFPIFFSDFEGGKVSLEENRTLEKFPDLFGEDAIPFKEVPGALEDWCADNIGFRNSFFSLYRSFTFKLLGISPTDNVHVGKDGWLFLTQDKNVEIGSGEYLLTEETLATIAKNQQQISDYYASLGKTYYFLMLPSKASIYPEKLSGANLEVGYTVIDQVEDYLSKNTSVKVINLKDTLLSHKNGEHLLFWETDTHWSSYGSYVGYLEIMRRMEEDGVLSANDLSPSFIMPPEGTSGDLSIMLGKDLIDAEKSVWADWNKNFVYDTESEEYKELSYALDALDTSPLYEVTRSEMRMLNSSALANGKSLLVYGDSMMMNERMINQYFAENFSEVQYVRVRAVSESIDAVVDPDIVIFEAYERLIEHVCTKEPTCFDAKTEIESRTEAPRQNAEDWIGEGGMGVEMSDRYTLTPDNKSIILNGSFDTYSFSGWAIDYMQKDDLDNLYIKVGDRYLSTNYGMLSGDIAQYFGIEEFDTSRFNFTLSKNYIVSNNITELQFVMLSSDGVHKYPIQSYTLTFDADSN